MKQLIEFETDAGATILVEVAMPESRYVEEEAAIGERVVEHARKTFQSALDVIKPISSALVSKFDGLSPKPDEFEVEFGLVFSADVGAVIASSGIEANIKVVLRWKQNDAKST